MNRSDNLGITPVGRFAPSPTGRMHLGNVFTALLSWLSVRTAGGRWILRIEDLDPQRSKHVWSELIEDDLAWLGLDYDEGGLDDRGPHGPYSQSARHDLYRAALMQLGRIGYTYRCRCTRAELLATQAPHLSDGRIIYPGTCRPAVMPRPEAHTTVEASPGDLPASGAVRLWAEPGHIVEFTDGLCGPTSINIARDCGDFVLQRADGAWAYQLAVVVDDALMGVTEIVRGNDLLSSVGQQDYLRSLLGYRTVKHYHVPLLCNSAGQRLSKRDGSLNMESLRRRYTPHQLIGLLGKIAGINPQGDAMSATELTQLMDWNRVTREPQIIVE